LIYLNSNGSKIFDDISSPKVGADSPVAYTKLPKFHIGRHHLVQKIIPQDKIYSVGRYKNQVVQKVSRIRDIQLSKPVTRTERKNIRDDFVLIGA